MNILKRFNRDKARPALEPQVLLYVAKSAMSQPVSVRLRALKPTCAAALHY